MFLFEERGVCIKDKTKFFIDASNPGENLNIVSHAHSDHARFRKNSNCLMTAETKDLILSSAPKAEIQTIKKKKKFQLNEFTISLHDSGHILGSSQILAENSSSLGVTTDLKLESSLLFKGAEILHPEILLIESTFGKPEYSFPSREETYNNLSNWIHLNLKQNHFVVLGGYATGKAQELTKFVNEYTKEIPLVYDKIFQQNKIYEKHGIDLGNYINLNNNFKDSNILILPPHLMDPELLDIIKHISGKNISAAVATGWPKRGIGCKTFPLSDHADFKQLMEYVKLSESKLVLTHHGFASDLAKHIVRDLKIPARPIGKKESQKILQEFN